MHRPSSLSPPHQIPQKPRLPRPANTCRASEAGPATPTHPMRRRLLLARVRPEVYRRQDAVAIGVRRVEINPAKIFNIILRNTGFNRLTGLLVIVPE